MLYQATRSSLWASPWDSITWVITSSLVLAYALCFICSLNKNKLEVQWNRVITCSCMSFVQLLTLRLSAEIWVEVQMRVGKHDDNHHWHHHQNRCLLIWTLFVLFWIVHYFHAACFLFIALLFLLFISLT